MVFLCWSTRVWLHCLPAAHWLGELEGNILLLLPACAFVTSQKSIQAFCLHCLTLLGKEGIWLRLTRNYQASHLARLHTKILPWQWIRVGILTGLHLYLLFFQRLLKRIPTGQLKNRHGNRQTATEWSEIHQERKIQVCSWTCIFRESSNLMQMHSEIQIEYSESEQPKS